ncbi:DUF3892 domain-containing protein [Clostridium sp. DL1XJH146]
MEKKEIVGIKKDNKGEIIGYKLDDDRLVSKVEAVELAKQGEIKGVTIATSKLGEEYLRSNPDSSRGNNLDNLPIVIDNLMI